MSQGASPAVAQLLEELRQLQMRAYGFGILVSARREQLGMTVVKAARRAGLSPDDWRAIEGGDAPARWKLRGMAAALELSRKEMKGWARLLGELEDSRVIVRGSPPDPERGGSASENPNARAMEAGRPGSSEKPFSRGGSGKKRGRGLGKSGAHGGRLIETPPDSSLIHTG